MGGKSKSATVGYWYEVAFHSGLGIGPIDAYLEFRGGDKTAWRGEATQSQTIHINAQNLWGGEKDQGGIVGAVDLMFGEATQQPSSRLAGIFGPQQPAWRGFATLAFAGKYGAMNPYPQKASHKIRKIREGWDGECWYPGKAAIPMPTCAGEDAYSYATSPPYVMEDVVELSASAAAIGMLNVSQPTSTDSTLLAAMPVDLENRLMRQVQSVASGQLAASAIPVGMENRRMRTVQQVYAGEMGVVASPVALEVLKTRVVLNRSQIPAAAVSATPVSIEVTTP